MGLRNLTNRMEETIGECTHLYITYSAMGIGYFAILRANRTIQDVLEAPDVDDEQADPEESDGGAESVATSATVKAIENIKANDIAILEDGSTVDGIVRFHAALREMTSRRGIRDEISRYEAICGMRSVSFIERHFSPIEDSRRGWSGTRNRRYSSAMC
jgi:hypothetical protein